MPDTPAPTTRQASAARSREALLDAGLTVAETQGLAGLSVNRVVQEAGVAKGTFYVHFADRAAFVDALHERFHAAVRAQFEQLAQTTEPGAELIQKATTAYLDASLQNQAVKALVVEARADGTASDTMTERSRAFGAFAEASFKVIGWGTPQIAARLYQSMVAEASLMELEAGKRLPKVRRTLSDWLTAGP